MSASIPPTDWGLRVRGLVKRFRRGFETVEVLRGVDLGVSPGEFVALMGPSGSGKTTLLHLIGGLDRPDGGTVTLGETALSSCDDANWARIRAARMGFVFQDALLIGGLSVAQNVELPLLLTNLTRAERRSRVDVALRLAGVPGRADDPPRTLSGGERQRVAIARALVVDASLLLCDEPTGNLDRARGDSILALLGTLASGEGKAILMVTHDRRAAAHATRVVHLEDGCIRDVEPGSR